MVYYDVEVQYLSRYVMMTLPLLPKRFEAWLFKSVKVLPIFVGVDII